ncbi:class I SAM-dependent methyltransferase [Paenibacillus aquistagni]|uniref:class I SAM-dependent methyltransferase n=1 Tax=Paenibacillus aquistagni TaxID=1852522 RepID=UPI00145BE865|nr:class I SAM-dependent methyltransferase [Paenibacillus aquistagni]NMM53909.1 class I SAM-dependent methyltransferase [Paenibacillus aquistagni]
MIPKGNSLNNIERFSGYSEIYDVYRPQAPAIITELLSSYRGERPSLVVDVGCGTGLSTFIWMGRAGQIIGVEPNEDMRTTASAKQMALGDESISFISSYSNQLAIDSNSADIITCSQSFHWMEPASTLKEFSRVLKSGGVFAAYDCDWPPTLHWELEEQYERLTRKADLCIASLVRDEEQARKRDKGQHLLQLRESGVFRFTKEVVFHHLEPCDAKRYVGLAFSQGGVQTVLKHASSELDEEIAAFQAAADEYFQGKTLQVLFSYRMRIGVK